MKFKRHQLAETYQQVHKSGRKHLYRRPYLLPLFGLFLGVVIVAGVLVTHKGHTLHPTNSHVVFLYDQNKRQTLDTRAATVGALLGKLPLNLTPQDVVEPAKDTPIVEDNFRINVYRARPVTVVDNGVKTVTLTAQKSPRVVAQAAGVTVYPEDNVSFSPGSIKENIIGEEVVINRATPVLLNLYGTPLTVRTHVKTVADLMAEKQIKLANGDTVLPSQTTPISANLQVFIVRNGVQIVTTEESIAPPTQIIQDSSLSFGTVVIRQAGAAGKRTVTYQVQTQNGVETGRAVIQQVVTLEPVPKIIARGSTVDISGNKTSLMAAAGISSDDYGAVNYIISRESNWNPASVNGSGCAGLGQACPGGKLAAACPVWQVDAVCQLSYFTGYANRYGGWDGAYNHWISYGWW
jgi:uncharacterized protein YabE (DUF348 family)